jgi:hypothetical protein
MVCKQLRRLDVPEFCVLRHYLHPVIACRQGTVPETWAAEVIDM